MSLRQTGEGRNPRMAHSVGNQDLFSLWVKNDMPWIAETSDISVAGRSASDGAQWGHITLCRAGIGGSGVIIPVGHPKLIAFGVNEYSTGALQAGVRPLQDANRGDIFMGVAVEEQNRVIARVGDHNLATNAIQVNPIGQIEPGL